MEILKPFLVILFVAASVAGAPAEAQDLPGRSMLLSYGPDLGRHGSNKWGHSVVTIELRPGQPRFGDIKPIWSVGLSGRGAVYVAGGIRADFALGPVLVTPHFSLALYQDGRGRFDSDELLQFRTGIDAFVPISDRAMLGLCYFHMSNAKLASKSANLDVVRLSVLFRL